MMMALFKSKDPPHQVQKMLMISIKIYLEKIHQCLSANNSDNKSIDNHAANELKKVEDKEFTDTIFLLMKTSRMN
jgi:hypothetical protein